MSIIDIDRFRGGIIRVSKWIPDAEAVLVFSVSLVMPGAVFWITARPDSMFKGEFLLVDGDAGKIRLSEVKIGNRNQFPAVPNGFDVFIRGLACWSGSESVEGPPVKKGLGVRFPLEIAMPGQDVSVCGYNYTEKPAQFRLWIVGKRGHCTYEPPTL